MRPIRSFDSECYDGVSAGVAVHGVECLGGDIRRDDPVHGLVDAILGGEVALEGTAREPEVAVPAEGERLAGLVPDRRVSESSDTGLESHLHCVHAIVPASDCGRIMVAIGGGELGRTRGLAARI